MSEPVLIGIMFSDGVIREMGTGKLSLIGCFSQWNAPGFPFQPPPFMATVMVTNCSTQVHVFDINVRLEEMHSGHVFRSVTAHIELPPDRPLQPNSVLECPLPFAGVVLLHAGTYVLSARINNEEVGKRTITCCAIAAAQPQNPPEPAG